MKVIAKVHSNKYICEVDHTEIEKFLNLYYGKKGELKIGDEISLGAGYDHLSEIRSAMNTTKEFIKSNQATVNAIINGLSLQQPGDGDEGR